MRDDIGFAETLEMEAGVPPAREPAWRETSCAPPEIVLLESDEASVGLHRAGPESPLVLIQASRTGSFVELPAGWWSLLVSVSGTVCAATSERLRWDIEPGRCLLWDRPLRVIGHRPDSRWFCLAGPVEAWVRAGGDARMMTELLADEMACPVDLPAHLETLRSLSSRVPDRAGSVFRSVLGIAGGLHARQSALRALTERCPGRTQRRKRWSMQRLLRIRHAILAGHQGEQRLSMEHLSRQVSYSRGHLARVYQSVFNETPSECAIRLRLQRALQMVEATPLAFCDIADRTGFDSQSSFSRAFKSRYGVTPTEARARGPGLAQP